MRTVLFLWAPSLCRRYCCHVWGARLHPAVLPLFVGRGRDLCIGLEADDLVALLAADELEPQRGVLVPSDHVDSDKAGVNWVLQVGVPDGVRVRVAFENLNDKTN
jgi:hypothetical protein